MNERGSRKIPVTERQFLWVQDDDKGEVTLHVGPTMVSPTAADRIVIDDGVGGFREDVSGRPQMMAEVGDHQYAVLFNPLQENDGGPNGRFRTGRNEGRPLRNGTRAMIPGPCHFWLRPGQRCEVRDAHELSASQYLVVKVYGPVDASAPYYDVTVRSAAITRATAEALDGRPTPLPSKPDGKELVRGQLIVIRGIDTQFYIPPTGVDIVPDTSVDESGATVSATTARQLVAQMQSQLGSQREAAKPSPMKETASLRRGDRMEEESLAESRDYGLNQDDEDGYSSEKGKAPRRAVAQYQAQAAQIVDQGARTRQRVNQSNVGQNIAPPPPPAPMSKAAAPALSAPGMQPPVGAAGPAGGAAPISVDEILQSDPFRKAIEREARQSRLVRHAVVLGEKEYCVLIDPDGKREIKAGPARVFPGPYDTFMIKGSRNRVYDAYELLPQRALWLRVISQIARAHMAVQMPRGVQLDKEVYYPGDEILLTGVSGFFFPFNEIEVLSPHTGEAVVGNDHSNVFIEAIGIDQKSGIYVRDLTTGEVRLVRGKQSYLVDPRKEIHITRTLSCDDWNLWITPGEPHKHSAQPITTPWAVSIVVPHNTAVLATSAAAQRIIEGPCVALLEYEETLVPLQLSTHTPKTDEELLQTCFLRTVGNRVSDIVTVETADFVRIHIRITSSVTFLRDHKDKWFNAENYVQVLCDHLRSIIRSRTRTLPLSALWPQIAAVVRDTVLGIKGEGDASRKGRFFTENGMHVSEVEVLDAVIDDTVIAEMMQTVQRESVTLAIGDRQAQEAMASTKLREELDLQRVTLLVQGKLRDGKLADLDRKIAQDARQTDLRDREALLKEQLDHTCTRERTELTARIEREAAQHQATLDALAKEAEIRAQAQAKLHAEEYEHQARLRHLELQLIEAQSRALVAERTAVQPQLVEALTALGDKALLTEVAHNMNLISLFRGKEAGEILKDVVGGSRFLPALEAALTAKPAPTPTPAAPTTKK